MLTWEELHIKHMIYALTFSVSLSSIHILFIKNKTRVKVVCFKMSESQWMFYMLVHIIIIIYDEWFMLQTVFGEVIWSTSLNSINCSYDDDGAGAMGI